MKPVLMLSLAALLAASTSIADDWKWSQYGLPKSELKTCIPATRGENDRWWMPYFHNKLKQPRKDVLFLGDSITDFWTYPPDHTYPGGLDTWNKRYKDIATNFGITGDRTDTVLWRLTEGKSLEGYSPKSIVLLIGVNNLLQGDSPEDVAAGIGTIVRYLRQRLPDSRVLLLGVFPCAQNPATPIRAKVKETNNLIKTLADSKKVFFADIGGTFLEKDDSISLAIMRDQLHLSPKGYEMWADAMEPHLKTLLNAKE